MKMPDSRKPSNVETIRNPRIVKITRTVPMETSVTRRRKIESARRSAWVDMRAIVAILLSPLPPGEGVRRANKNGIAEFNPRCRWLNKHCLLFHFILRIDDVIVLLLLTFGSGAAIGGSFRTGLRARATGSGL